MTQEAIIWMITVQVSVTLTTLFLFYKVLKKDGYDSVFAMGGADSSNNEFIVYKPEQCTITHLVEISG